VIWRTVIDVAICSAITAGVIAVLVVARLAAFGRDV